MWNVFIISAISFNAIHPIRMCTFFLSPCTYSRIDTLVSTAIASIVLKFESPLPTLSQMNARAARSISENASFVAMFFFFWKLCDGMLAINCVYNGSVYLPDPGADLWFRWWAAANWTPYTPERLFQWPWLSRRRGSPVLFVPFPSLCLSGSTIRPESVYPPPSRSAPPRPPPGLLFAAGHYWL